MGNAGHGHPPYVLFRQALDAGDLQRVRELASRMPRVNLQDALRICLLMREHDGFERCAVRWLGRFALEAAPVSIEDVQLAAAALDALPHRPESAMDRLAAVCLRCGVA
ncbi:MAG TPA: hypothetical protein VGM91_19435 [Conexibacter sp.]|jgi:hypothetical protein